MAQEDIDKFLQDVWDTNENLTVTDFRIWKLHQEGYRNPEIAETLGLDIALVERRKHYVRNILKEAINKKRKNKGSSSHLWLILAGFWKVIYFGINGLRNYVYSSTTTKTTQS
jgi:hypothetical protein